MNQNNMPTHWLKNFDEIFKSFYLTPFLSSKEEGVFSEVEETIE